MKADIILIAAKSRNNVIGSNGKMPWHIPNDLKFFKEMTMGYPLIMGRKTRESFGSKPLPNRPHLVISRDKDYQAEGSMVFDSIEEAKIYASQLLEHHPHPKIYIIGGGDIYKQTLKDADYLYITQIDADYEGDTYFPDFTPDDYKKDILGEYSHHTPPYRFIKYYNLKKK